MAFKKPDDPKGKARRSFAKKPASRPAAAGVMVERVYKKRYADRLMMVTPRDIRAALDRVVYARTASDGARATRLNEGAEIVAQVKDWAGSMDEAGKWYRSQPIPALGDRTAEALVMSGQAALVREYLDHLSQGGYA
ncbi:MAG: antitoxin Xre/MbcA/ParS toxin-binding domain-containing protein [Paracoccus sp. (in: a-proteobacteria)]